VDARDDAGDLARAAGGLLGIRAGVRRALALCGARGTRGGTTTLRTVVMRTTYRN
jgi:hypothetical protein